MSVLEPSYDSPDSAAVATDQLERTSFRTGWLGPPRPSPGTITEPLVEVEATGPSGRSTLRHLGSITERHGMPMYQHRAHRDRVSVLVPRALSQKEAEAVVATLLERIRHWA